MIKRGIPFLLCSFTHIARNVIYKDYHHGFPVKGGFQVLHVAVCMN